MEFWVKIFLVNIDFCLNMEVLQPWFEELILFPQHGNALRYHLIDSSEGLRLDPHDGVSAHFSWLILIIQVIHGNILYWETIYLKGTHFKRKMAECHEKWSVTIWPGNHSDILKTMAEHLQTCSQVFLRRKVVSQILTQNDLKNQWRGLGVTTTFNKDGGKKWF